MITAQEARAKASSMESTKNKKEMEKCERVINDAVLEGLCKTSVGFWLSDPVKKQLETLGYKIKSEQDRNEAYTTITW
jgi:hypothetical protein